MTAESAVYMTAQHFYQLFSKMEDEYMRARDTDILDISRHLLRYLNLENVEPLDESIGKGIIAVEELFAERSSNGQSEEGAGLFISKWFLLFTCCYT